jgi:peptidoglycan biosynthesis protein MviN/MurJ (putative lipid II flippase)
MMGTVYYRTEPLVDRALSSLAASGDLSLYYLCQQVSASAMQVSNNALIAPLVPALAEHAKAGQWAAFNGRFRRGVVTVLCAATAGYLVLMVGGGSAIAMTAAPGNALFSRAWWLIAGLAGVFVAGPVSESFRTAFYATGNTATPVRIDVSVFTLGLALKVVGFALFGIWGMAFAASAQAFVGLFSLRHLLSRYIGGLERAEGDGLARRETSRS